MPTLSDSEALELCERLVATVGRAFYPDSCVIVLDALIQEKFILREEFAPRLRLPNSEIAKVLARLHD